MLVLTRRADEGIQLGEDIRIVILGIDNDRVRIGIDAPRTLRIFRSELINETRDANVEAARQTPVTTIRFSAPNKPE